MDSRGIYGYIYIYIYHFLASKEERPSTRTDMNPTTKWLDWVQFLVIPKTARKWAKLPMPHFPFVISSRHCSHMNPTNLGTISDDWAKNLAGAQTQNGYGAFSIHFCDALRCQFVQKHPEKELVTVPSRSMFCPQFSITKRLLKTSWLGDHEYQDLGQGVSNIANIRWKTQNPGASLLIQLITIYYSDVGICLPSKHNHSCGRPPGDSSPPGGPRFCAVSARFHVRYSATGCGNPHRFWVPVNCAPAAAEVTWVDWRGSVIGGRSPYDWAGCNMLQRILCWDKAGHSSKSRGVIESQFTLDNDDSHFAWLYVSLIYIYIHNYTHITYVTYVQYIPVYPPNFLLRYISKLVVFLDPSCSVVPHLQSSTAGAVSSPMWSFTLTSAIYLHRYK